MNYTFYIGDQYKAGRYLQPELTTSQLGFKDLLWDSGSGGVSSNIFK